jgi:solute carrier family 25 phosphate transporter 23/24/25/41
VPKWKLEQFFDELDKNNDGVITFEEWRFVPFPLLVCASPCLPEYFYRDFLLFLPADASTLRSALSYYAATGTLNPEGDVQINQPFAGSGTADHFPTSHKELLVQFLQPSSPHGESMSDPTPLGRGTVTTTTNTTNNDNTATATPELEWLSLPANIRLWMWYEFTKQILTESTPHAGYFLAGGMAGVVSRTATAPLDRLKVYLIAQTDVRAAAEKVVKSRSFFEALTWMGKPLVDATKELWRAGGIRSLFAGSSCFSLVLLGTLPLGEPS